MAVEIKTCVFALEYKETDEGLGYIEGYGATFEDPEDYDWYGDIIAPGAFDADIKARGPQGSNEIVMLWGHGDPFGMPVTLSTDSKGLRIKGVPTDTAENIDRMKYIRHGVVRGLSIGYIPTKVAYLPEVRTAWGTKVRELLEITTIEVSPTPNPANPSARIDGVKNWKQAKSGMWEPDRCTSQASDTNQLDLRRQRAAAWLKRAKAFSQKRDA